MTKKIYTSPSVEHLQLTGMHCLCDPSCTTTSDLPFVGTTSQLGEGSNSGL